MPWAHPRKIVNVGFYLALAVLAFMTLIAYLEAGQLIQDSALTIRSTELQSNLHELLSTLVDAESAQRGYVITSNKRFLGPYQSAIKHIDALTQEIARLVSGKPTYHSKFNTIQTLILQKLALLKERIALLDNGEHEAAIRSIKTEVGLDLMENIRGLINNIDSEEHELLQLANKKLAISSKRALFIIPIGTLASFTIIFLAFNFLQREVVRRRRAEEALQKSEQEIRMLVGNVPAIVFKGYADWSIDFLDQRVAEILGYPKADFDSRQLKWDELILEEDILPAKMIFIQALKTNKSYIREYRIINKEEKITWIQERSRIVLSPDGKIEYISGIFFDITELKESEKSLDQLRSQLELILNAAWEGILGLDINGKHTFINPTAAKMLGYEVKELIGKSSHAIWHHSKSDGSPYPEEECPIYNTFRYGIIQHVRDEVFWRKDGTSFQVAYSGTPIMEDGRIIGAVVTFWDISERKRAELERERLINELRDALTQVKTLKGLLPICAHCKKIRDDEGYWQSVEKFIHDRSEVEFSHGICPDCLKEYYPSFINTGDSSEKEESD